MKKIWKIIFLYLAITLCFTLNYSYAENLKKRIAYAPNEIVVKIKSTGTSGNLKNLQSGYNPQLETISQNLDLKAQLLDKKNFRLRGSSIKELKGLPKKIHRKGHFIWTGF